MAIRISLTDEQAAVLLATIQTHAITGDDEDHQLWAAIADKIRDQLQQRNRRATAPAEVGE